MRNITAEKLTEILEKHKKWQEFENAVYKVLSKEVHGFTIKKIKEVYVPIYLPGTIIFTNGFYQFIVGTNDFLDEVISTRQVKITGCKRYVISNSNIYLMRIV